MSLHSLRRINLEGFILDICPVCTQASTTTLLHALHHCFLCISVRALEQLFEKVIWIGVFLLVIIAKLVPILWSIT